MTFVFWEELESRLFMYAIAVFLAFSVNNSLKSIESVMVSLVTVVPKHFAMANALLIIDKERSGLHL